MTQAINTAAFGSYYPVEYLVVAGGGTGGTISSSGGFTYHTFTTSGTFTA